MTERADRLRRAVRSALEERGATAFVHAGTSRNLALRYCLLGLLSNGEMRAIATREGPARADREYAIATDGERVFSARSGDGSNHPAAQLAARLREADHDGLVLTPRHVPHDAALYLEDGGFSLASTDLLDRVRARKTPPERERIATAQAAAAAGIRRGAAALAAATAADGHLEADGAPLTLAALRRAVDGGIVDADGFPAGNTTIEAGDRGPDDAVPAGVPIAIAVAAREPGGYHGRLLRTFVVDGEGGPERRAHVAVSRAFDSARAYLSTDGPTVGGAAADLAAEIRAFGFDDGIETAVYGIGLEPAEAPAADGATIEPGAVVALEASVADEGVRLATLFERTEAGARALDEPSRSLDPSAL